MKAFLAILSSLFLTSCVTASRPHDPSQPALSWDAACEPENLPGTTSWLLLTCTLTNRSHETLTLEAIDRITSEGEIWRQPDSAELAALQRDFQTRKTVKTLPLVLQGGDRVEGFVAQMLVVSGLWLIQSARDPVQLPEKTEKTLQVKPGASVRQAFVLYKDSLESPSFVTLISADRHFQKQVNFAAAARQRIAIPD